MNGHRRRGPLPWAISLGLVWGHMTKRILLVFAHPAPRRSRYNSRLLREAARLDHVAIRDLYELYPDMHINVTAEQAALRAADAIVFQFPIYWFSAPAVLKEWQDCVLTKGFAFGRGGTVLEGKKCMLAVSTGGGLGSYDRTGPHGAPLETYLKPFEQTALFCGMRLADTFVTQGVGDLDDAALAAAAARYTRRLMEFAEED
ncbi:MAG: hypothetical protein EP335_07300 [Alphaproteobacteria bacterium]|nr:MAG: hypothetical protein EP335_07300 [Alphaproteobacteria bacterium]